MAPSLVSGALSFASYRAKISRAQTTASAARIPAGWGPGPELQGLWAIVVTHPVEMMHGLLWQQVTAEQLLHNQDVFKNVLPAGGSRVSGCPKHDIALFVARLAAAPVAVRCATIGPACVTARILHSLSCPARAEIVRPARWAAPMTTRWRETSPAFCTSSSLIRGVYRIPVQQSCTYA